MVDLSELYSAQVIAELPTLLSDKTTKGNIIWATDAYASLGEGYDAKHEMTPAHISIMGESRPRPRIQKEADEQQDRTRKHAEVFTPAWICNKMNNACDEIWLGGTDVFNAEDGKNWVVTGEAITFPQKKSWQQYVDLRVIEITCGEAPFLASRYDTATGDEIPIKHRIGILDRKLRIVRENANGDVEWLKWAIRAFQSVYGYEFQGDNLLIARVNLLLTFADAALEVLGRPAKPEELHCVANIISWNLWQMDGLKGTVPFGTLQESSIQLSLLDLLSEEHENSPERCPRCRIMDWRGMGSICYSDRMTRKGKEMKFDFVIGNPPYQITVEGTSDKPVYNEFMDAAYQIADRVELITPARFLFNAGKTPKIWNEKMLSDTHLRVLYYEQNSGKVFANTDIKGGIAITYRDSSMSFGAIGMFSQFSELNRIRDKVTHNPQFSTICSIIHQQSKFDLDVLYNDFPDYQSIVGSDGRERRLTTKIFEQLPVFTEDRISESQIGIIGLIKNKRFTRYIERKYNCESDDLFAYKVLVPASNGTGAIGEVLSTPLIGEPLIGEPLIGYTQSFIGFGNADNEGYAIALIKYIKCKFTRCLLGVLKITQHNHAETWRYVPLQDFAASSDIDWSRPIPAIDQQLYKKYGLSEEEIAFIETHVKEMS